MPYHWTLPFTPPYSRMQTIHPASGPVHPSTISILRMTIRESGFRSLYTGLSASVLRQMTYSLVRLGAYEKMKANLSKDGPAPGSHLLLAAMLAGALGGLAGNPAGKHTLNHEVSPNCECLLPAQTSYSSG